MTSSTFVFPYGFGRHEDDAREACAAPITQSGGVTPLLDLSSEREPNEGDGSLEDVARKEQEFLRERLRDELQREPSEEELNEYQRQHTEGY